MTEPVWMCKCSHEGNRHPGGHRCVVTACGCRRFRSRELIPTVHADYDLAVSWLDRVNGVRT